MALRNPTKFWPLPNILPNHDPRVEFQSPRWTGPIPNPHDQVTLSVVSPFTEQAHQPIASPHDPLPVRKHPPNYHGHSPNYRGHRPQQPRRSISHASHLSTRASLPSTLNSVDFEMLRKASTAPVPWLDVSEPPTRGHSPPPPSLSHQAREELKQEVYELLGDVPASNTTRTRTFFTSTSTVAPSPVALPAKGLASRAATSIPKQASRGNIMDYDDDIHLGKGSVSLASLTYAWCHASFLYYASNLVVAHMAFEELLKRPGIPLSIQPRLVLNMGIISTHVQDPRMAAECFYRAIGLVPNGSIAAIGVFLLGVAVFDLRDAERAAKCFEICVGMFPDEVERIDLKPLGLDFVLWKADVRSNHKQCLEKIKVDRVFQMTSRLSWSLVRLPEDRIFEPPLAGDPAAASVEAEMRAIEKADLVVSAEATRTAEAAAAAIIATKVAAARDESRARSRAGFRSQSMSKLRAIGRSNSRSRSPQKTQPESTKVERSTNLEKLSTVTEARGRHANSSRIDLKLDTKLATAALHRPMLIQTTTVPAKIAEKRSSSDPRSISTQPLDGATIQTNSSGPAFKIPVWNSAPLKPSPTSRPSHITTTSHLPAHPHDPRLQYINTDSDNDSLITPTQTCASFCDMTLTPTLRHASTAPEAAYHNYSPYSTQSFSSPDTSHDTTPPPPSTPNTPLSSAIADWSGAGSANSSSLPSAHPESKSNSNKATPTPTPDEMNHDLNQRLWNLYLDKPLPLINPARMASLAMGPMAIYSPKAEAIMGITSSASAATPALSSTSSSAATTPSASASARPLQSTGNGPPLLLQAQVNAHNKYTHTTTNKHANDGSTGYFPESALASAAVAHAVSPSPSRSRSRSRSRPRSRSPASTSHSPVSTSAMTPASIAKLEKLLGEVPGLHGTQGNVRVGNAPVAHLSGNPSIAAAKHIKNQNAERVMRRLFGSFAF